MMQWLPSGHNIYLLLLVVCYDFDPLHYFTRVSRPLNALAGARIASRARIASLASRGHLTPWACSDRITSHDVGYMQIKLVSYHVAACYEDPLH